MYPALHLEFAQTITAERDRVARRFRLFPRRSERIESAPTPPRPLAVVLEHPTLREHRVRRQLAA